MIGIREAYIPRAMILLLFSLGCRTQGGTQVPIELSPRNDTPDERVATEWVFTIPDELALTFGIYPMVMHGWVAGGAVTNERVLLLCNLGGATEATIMSRAYVVDLKTGTMARRMSGPAHTDGFSWIVTERMMYFRVVGSEAWQAFNMESGKLERSPPSPDVQKVLAKRDGPLDEHLSAGLSGENVTAQSQRFCWDIGQERTLEVWRESRVGGTEEFILNWRNTAGHRLRKSFCRLPVRAYEGTGNVLLLNNDRHILFTWGGRVICLDARNLHQ